MPANKNTKITSAGKTFSAYARVSARKTNRKQ